MVGGTNFLGQLSINNSQRPLAFLWSIVGGTSYSIGSVKWSRCSSTYFTYADGVFTVKKAFSGELYGAGVGGKNTSGTSSVLYWKVERNGTEVFSKSGGGATSSYSSAISFAVNDTIRIRGYVTQANTPSEMFLCIRTPSS